MKMKKVFAMVLALALSATMVGCASSATTAEVEEEVFTLRVGMECAYAPFNWAQENDDNGAVLIADTSEYAYGYDVMIAQAICEELGYELEVVRLDWDSLIPALQAGTINAIIAGQSMTPERAEQVDFTTPYYYAKVVSLVKADGDYVDATCVDDFAGAVATSQLGTFWYNDILPQLGDSIDLLPAQETVPAMLVALESGAVELVVTDEPTGLAACRAYPDMVMLNFYGTEGDFESSEEYVNMGISVKKGDTELLEGINSVLENYTPEDYTEMMNYAIEVQPLDE